MSPMSAARLGATCDETNAVRSIGQSETSVEWWDAVSRRVGRARARVREVVLSFPQSRCQSGA